MSDFISQRLKDTMGRPTSQERDTVYGTYDNQRDPYTKEYNDYVVRGDNGGGGNSPNPNGPWGGWGWITELINGILAGIRENLKIVMSNQWNGYELNRMFNNSILDSMRRN